MQWDRPHEERCGAVDDATHAHTKSSAKIAVMTGAPFALQNRQLAIGNPKSPPAKRPSPRRAK
jgi:hypothetical protein